MSMLSEAMKTAWNIHRGETTVEDEVTDFAKDWFAGVTSPVHRMPNELRCQHLLAVGRSGCGKSSFLYGLMAKDIPEALDRKKTLIVIDPVNGIDKIVKETGIAHEENVFLIDPADPDSLPRLDLFETGVKRSGILETSYMINNFRSVCAGLLDQEMTPAMSTLFGYCARVLMNVENRTLNDLMDLLIDPIVFMDEIGMSENDPTYQFFVEDVVGSKGKRGAFADTVKYIRNRVHGFLNDPIIERLLINRNPTMSMAKVIEAGSIVLIATRKASIGADGARVIGKFCKHMINRVVQERSQSEKNGVQINFYEDEFQNSLSGGFDQQLATMLDENRKFGLSINLATTRFGHINTDMADAVLTCTASKVCGTMVSKGIGLIGPELKRPPDEISNLPNYTLFVKAGSDMKKAIKIKSPKDPFKSFKNDPNGMKTLRDSMNRRFGTTYVKKFAAQKPEGSEIEDVEM